MNRLLSQTFKIIVLLGLNLYLNQAHAITLFGDGFEDKIYLNDTGITWGGDSQSGNNTTCTSNIASPQDCHQGRDATLNDDSDGHAGFSFTKLDEFGNLLAASATSWSCVRDNVTGLVWEVKSTDSNSIHYRNNNFRWGGITHQGSNFGTYYNDWDVLVNGTNSENLCGFNDWRVPNSTELMSIVDNSRYNPSIDTDYFPNTIGSSFWSASPRAYNANYAWYVYFSLGGSSSLDRYVSQKVRLVRFGQ